MTGERLKATSSTGAIADGQGKFFTFFPPENPESEFNEPFL
jgi:hypothetical protein